MSNLPSNVNISKHPCLRAKLSQLRSKSANARETKDLVHEVSLILGTQALASLEVVSAGADESPIGFQYDFETISPQKITIVPILRSGLGMLDALQTILPFPVSVHHLGLFREKISLQPVEYYNNLPQSRDAVAKLAIIVDPVIATGGTAAAAIQTLREWGVDRIIMIGILGATEGVIRAAEEWPEGVEIWMGGVDQSLTDKGMINPGLGDIGDRLFLTLGK
ncbi:putative uracil phosphoribosyltransferase urg2 [Cyphellophora attinorum]|uniref:uracil phosphoribosyltransferase n=1 Tax=Cyphellophora attinorum TaxID=1664694 RepID=A0A0N1H8I5_9EURO|nr:putative uracil phosphoribosyltransferase urg2 [Phialophora attinorum]KPI38246.1 putative uracil phosphoribosyltransferase urg2 [Phialophora attinorum]